MSKTSVAIEDTVAVTTVALNGAQAGIWVADQVAPIANGYVVAHWVDLHGALDADCLVDAIRCGLAETDTPHARFVETDDGVVQHLPRTVDAAAIDVTVEDLRGEDDPLAAALARMQSDLAQPLRGDAAGPLFRHAVYRIGEQRYAWYQRYHHLCVDGYSFAAVSKRIAAIYSARVRHEVPAPAAQVGFDAVVDEAQRYAQSDAAARDRAFWRDYGAQLAAPVSLSTRDVVSASTFANVDVLRERVSVAASDVAAFAAAMQPQGGSALEALMAALFCYVQRCTDTDAVVAGIPFMRRLGSVAMDASGPVVNVLPLQLCVTADATLATIAAQLRTELARVRRHQRCDAEQVQRDLGLVGSGRALYGPTINLKIYDQTLALDAVRGSLHVLAAGPVEDLEFALWPDADAAVIELSANPARYDAAELALHAARLSAFLSRLAADPQRAIAAIELRAPAEAAQLAAWSQGPDPRTRDAAASVLDRLRAQVATDPDAIAVVCGAERLSFAALAQRAQAIADGLRAVGVARGDIVAVALPRSADSIAAVFGVFAAGAVYLPLDLDYPAERLATIAADARPRAIVTRRDVNPALAATPLFLDALAPSGRPRAALLRDAALSAGDAAYLIYTSGSTGTPKGVLATHGGLLNLLRSHEADAFGALTSARGARRLRAAHTTSFAFDAAWEQIIWLLLGQELHICDDEVRRDAQALLAFVHERAIDALDVPPVLLQALVDAGLLDDPARLPGLILTGSEAVPPALWRTLREVPGLRVCNCYGPTEYTVDALSAQLAVAATPVIGRPVARTRAYVLDRRLQPLPVGATGELYLAGAGLAHGYRGRAALTATRFVADPFVAGERMYRSGDCVRWRADGQLEFLGRGDRQVKIRGFRVEPGEVEQVLRGLPGVADAIVQAQTCGMTLRLVGYCTPTADAALDADMVRRELAARVPDYLVPAGIAVLAQWPLTTNGKIDRRALPDVTAPATARREAANPRERLICAGIAQVLGLPAVGADDDFFALGGDSISAMALGTQLRRDGYRLAPREIFAQRTPARMAAALTTLRESRARGAEADGAIGRLPIVAWFAEHCGMDSRYAQGVIVRVPATLNAHVLAQALAALQRAHPALRARAAGGVLVVGPARPLVVQDDTGDDGPFVARANRLFRTSAAALAPSAGHLMQATLLRGDGASWLLLVAHHLIVDGVSWRVLLPELRAACEAAASGAMPFVAPEETTLREWAAALAAEVPQRRSEIDQWRAALAEPLPLHATAMLQPGRDTYGRANAARTLLPPALSAAVLQTLPDAYRATVEELVLCAVARACVARWPAPRLRVALESHGRASDDERIDLARTVGWLTAEYPVVLDFAAVAADDGAACVRAVKQALRAIPDRGRGYGVLRWLDADNAPALAALEHAHRPALLFNYLGRFVHDEGQWTPQSVGGAFADAFAVDIDPATPLSHALEINVFVDESGSEPQLAVNWTWADALFDAQTLATLQAGVAAEFERLVRFASAAPERAADTLAAADTRNARGVALDAAQLDRLRMRYGAAAAVLPVLPLQEGLLFHAELGERASRYNAISRLDFSSDIDAPRLRAALDAVLRRHPQLAARFDLDADAQPLQVLPLAPASWPWSEVNVGAGDDVEVVLRRIERGEIEREFAIGRGDGGPLLHAVLVHCGAGRSVVFVTAHHLVVDGWSTPLLVRDLLDAYAGAIAPPPQVPYADVVRALATRDLSAARAAWTDAMTGARPTLLFEGQAASPDVGEIEFALPAALDAALRARARERGLTVNTVMQGAWAALLATLTGRDDVVFGAPVSGRFGALAGIADHIGLFSNTVPVRLRLTPHEPLLRQLERLQAQQIALLEHDGLGLAEIQRLAHTNPLFDTLLVSENYPDDASLHARDYAGARLAGLRNRGYTHYPLTVLVLPGETLQLIVEYRDVVREPQRVVGRLLHLLQHLADDATTPWSRFDPRLADERALVDAVNATAHPVPATTLCALIAAQIARTPQATALQDIRDSLTYAQMDRQAGALAARLQAAGVRLGDIVAVALPRSVRLSVALLAVQRAGAAYLPLDTGYPDERLAYMVSDAQPRLLIATGDLAARFGAFAPVLLFDALAADDETAAPSLPALAPQHAAYLLYTSGSTGRPKGVLVSHEAIVNRLLWMQHEYALAADDTVLQKTPSSFDVSVWEFFWPLLVGARLFLAPPDAHRDPEELLRVIEAQRVTTLHFVPSMLAAFVAHLRTLPDATARCTDLRRVFCSGEALPRDLAQRWTPLQSAPLHNLYGPTEAAVDVTFKAAADDDAGTRVAASVPIGRPVWNTQLRILDAQLRPVPVGAPGELYLCGVQLADGYRGRAALTATRFVADPFGDGARMYRTGDIARWLGTGDVEYLGRCDDQLKIRGQRIELGEIEAVLTAQPGVAQAVVVARVIGVAGTDGDARQLVGYVVPRNAQAFDASTLRTALAQQLPAHMVPVAFVELAALPLSTSGKLDRQALPAPELHSSDAREPQTELERLIARAFAQVLERDTVAADADFFALGGHSLAAMRLAAELRRVLQRPVSVGQIMGAASVATLAALLSATDGAAAANAGFGEILSLRAGEGMPLVCIHPASGFAWQYAGLARYLPEGLPLIGLQSPRPDGAIAASADMDAVCERHLANLRRVQPQGPYRLLGYSLGGTVAHGIAARLRAAGETVAFLGLLDTYPPEGQDWSGPAEAEAQSEVEREQAQFLAAADTDDDALVQREKAAMFERIVANYQDAVRLLSQARTPKLAGDAVLFVATRTLPAGWDVRDSWAPYLDALHVHELDCAHEDLLDPQNLQAVGALLAQRLRDSGIG